ncbi:DUF6510 family protein [Ruania alba]|uniref:Uncharacterized protein n=1 Tax=Ruania alba TaxID=648782 RepID=A0A1H5M5A5_9MICO|nr:DUF6510 family protein [Ruania alba]SEE83688.1 hypothetical protein SAMN04488554_3123 [Ruania alba]
MSHVDGSAILGILAIGLGRDMSGTELTCAGCGDRHVVERTRVYRRCPGIVVRCPGCDGVELLVTEIRRRIQVQLRGVANVQF